jgi:tRNA 2-(methylsulfanyl)-N6-isopentenyladenosine37 hydroxylase
VLHLSVPSDAEWVKVALADLDALLVDHAHCEMKAASNALSVALRHPGDLGVVRVLTHIAREESLHFDEVLDLLVARGLALGSPPPDPYVAALRRAQSAAVPSKVDRKVAAAVDRLLVCALIEARSCERFHLLSEALVGVDDVLAAFYARLRASEARHFRTFVDLAVRVAEGDEASVLDRLDVLSLAEGVIVREQAAQGSRQAIHG